MAKSEELCAEPYCRTPATIIVLGKPLCDKHNEERLERVERAYQTLRAEGVVEGF